MTNELVPLTVFARLTFINDLYRRDMNSKPAGNGEYYFRPKFLLPKGPPHLPLPDGCLDFNGFWAKVQEIAVAAMGQQVPADFKWGLKDGLACIDKNTGQPYKGYAESWRLSTKTTNQIAIGYMKDGAWTVFPDGIVKDYIYPGSWVAIGLAAGVWSNANGRGMSFFLNSICFLAKGEKIAEGGAPDPAQTFAGFTSEQVAFQAPGGPPGAYGAPGMPGAYGPPVAAGQPPQSPGYPPDTPRYRPQEHLEHPECRPDRLHRVTPLPHRPRGRLLPSSLASLLVCRPACPRHRACPRLDLVPVHRRQGPPLGDIPRHPEQYRPPLEDTLRRPAIQPLGIPRQRPGIPRPAKA